MFMGLVPVKACATIRIVRPCAVLLALLLFSPVDLSAQDPLGEARRLYNAGDFDQAEAAARMALESPSTANSARVVLGRIHLERYRRGPTGTALVDARAAFREVDPLQLEPRERIELTLGFAETLFLEDRFAAAAEMFRPILASSGQLGDAAHERVLDWWATSLDRHAQTRPMAERPAIYARIAERMHGELERDPGSIPAGYWVEPAGTSTRPGTRRPRPGSAQRSAGIAASSFAATSIAWSSRRSSRNARPVSHRRIRRSP
jgi:hypothetical protein